ncbi:HK97 family phage portal protein [Thermosporothrix hazakensis]|uniref:HK97 family phage portal protein n=1 Tax=Thermosporothrix hazakensis TaxID=644383 RepID=A0A326U949_THEHA|nr:phage portal protein [Thermosporothrix hazakensis]PZW28396.1 HK97 family phage portal protein [Thermosporothrix hazakensis]GCE45176.1 hypothetical protein KTH_00450 [Thermosporothrix hazakensis]
MSESLLIKAYTVVRRSLLRSRGSRGALSDYKPGQLGTGQPPQTVASDGTLVTPERKREIALKTPTMAACLNATIDYVTPVKISVQHVDPSKAADPERGRFILDYLDKPNKRDSRKHFLEAIYRDLIVLGYAAIEIERDSRGRPANLYPLDAARLQIDFDEHGNVLGYNMRDSLGNIIKGEGGHTWKSADVIFLKRDSSSSSVYPFSRLDQLYACAVIESLMLHFIGSKFTEGNIPYGVLSLGDLTEQELKLAVESWNQQAQSNHRILLTGSRGDMNWVEFGYALKDLDATALLHEVQAKIMAILGVTANELGQAADVNKSNGFNLSYTFKRRAIDPLLREFTGTMTRRLLWDELQMLDLALTYDEVDSRDELLQRQIDEIAFKNGFASINEIRNARGEPSIEGGDEHVVILGATALPVRMLTKYAEAQLEALVNPPMFGAPGQPQPKENKRPGEQNQERKAPGDAPQKPRGTTQKLRNTGLRKEDTHG